MEVKPDIIDVWIANLLDHLAHFLSNPILAALLVNQIHPVLFLVISLRLSHVFQSRLIALIEVGIHGHWWRPRHRWLHLPDQRNAPTNLQVTRDRKASICLLLCDNMLCLTEVCGVALAIKPSHHESSSHPSCIFA